MKEIMELIIFTLTALILDLPIIVLVYEIGKLRDYKKNIDKQ